MRNLSDEHVGVAADLTLNRDQAVVIPCLADLLIAVSCELILDDEVDRNLYLLDDNVVTACAAILNLEFGCGLGFSHRHPHWASGCE